MTANSTPVGLVWCRWIYLALVVWQLVWFGYLVVPTAIPVAVGLAIALVPLLVFLPGVWRLRPRALVLAGCVLLFYFSYAVMEWWMTPAAALPAGVQTVITSAYFIALLRLRAKPARP